MKILIVEDDPASMILANKILAKEGHHTLRAESVEKAISIIRDNPSIEMVLCDISLPGADGFSLIRFLKKNPAFSKIPILICSNISNKEAITHSLKLGADDYILKPLESSAVNSKIDKAVRKLKSCKILVVDDQKYILDILARSLSIEGYQVYMAESAEEAMNLLNSFEISAVITDIVMPGIDGLGLTAMIKDKNPDTPVFLITGHTEKYKKEVMLKAGADGFIKKPFKNVEIIEQLRKFVQPLMEYKNL